MSDEHKAELLKLLGLTDASPMARMLMESSEVRSAAESLLKAMKPKEREPITAREVKAKMAERYADFMAKEASYEELDGIASLVAPRIVKFPFAELYGHGIKHICEKYGVKQIKPWTTKTTRRDTLGVFAGKVSLDSEIEGLRIEVVEGDSAQQPKRDNSMTDVLNQRVAEAATTWKDIEAACRHGRRVLLWGPPGTGKSRTGSMSKSQLAAAGADEVFRLYLTLETPAAEVRGHYVPTSKDGFEWHDGPATVAWRKGARLIIEEIDAASGDCLSWLLGVLDDPEMAFLTLPTNERIAPSAGFSCVATSNQPPASIPEALLDRFDVVINVTVPSPSAFDPMQWHSPQLCEAAKRCAYLPDEKVRGQGGRPIGLRAFKSVDRMMASGMATQDAARLVLGVEAGKWLCMAMALDGAKD
jgi:hypothetical protein